MKRLVKLLIVLLIAANCKAVVNQTKAQPTETPRFFYKGVLMSDCTIPGEQKKDNIQPSNAICCQLSKNRWAWIYVTTSFQGLDSVRAIVYQIRKDTPDGEVLKEGIFSPFTDKWDPFNDGSKYFKQQGQCKMFGVPKGAVDKNGKLLPNNNVFVASWYQNARVIDHNTGKITASFGPEQEVLGDKTVRVTGIQFKLNDAEDDIVFLTPITSLRQKGFEKGKDFCELGSSVKTSNHWYVPFLPYNEECTQWADVWHFKLAKGQIVGTSVTEQTHGIAPVMMEFNSETGLYEWTKTGQIEKIENINLIEASLLKYKDQWIIHARPRPMEMAGVGVWYKTKDLFGGLGKPIIDYNDVAANRSAYLCGDGVPRIFGGSKKLSPFKWSRNPQYCWDINPDTFALSNCKTVLSTDDIDVVATNYIKNRAFLSPVFQGRQIVTITLNREITGVPEKKDLDSFGVHYWYVTYDKDIKDQWQFAK